MPKASVLITAYNYGRFLPECLDSVLSQDWAGWEREVIVVDDGSTDDTQERVKPYLDRVRCVRQENAGQGQGMNKGYEESSGEILMMHDADDLWYPGKVARVLKEFVEHPEAGFVQHPLDASDAQARLLWKADSVPPPDIRLKDVLDEKVNLIGAPGLSIRRDIFKKIHPVPAELRYCADEYVSKHALFFAPGRTVPQTYGRFRIHDKNSYQRTEWDPGKIERYLFIRERLDHHLDERLKKEGMTLAPGVLLNRRLDRRRKEILLHGWRGERAQARKALGELAKELPPSSLKAFKLATLSLATVSPRAYLSLHDLYARFPLLSRLRRSAIRG